MHQDNAHVYLKSGVKLEPLSCGWYVWGHLVSPVQNALNLAFRQLPLLKSFIATPSVHEAASNDPALLGAPFLQLPRSEVPAVAALLAATTEQCGPLLQFAQDFIGFTRQLQESASGFSHDESYSRMPASLRGFVELTYDLGNHPGIRIVEELAMAAELDCSATQQLALCEAKDSERSFFLNTPRLESPARLILPLAFTSEQVDLLAASRIRPVPVARLLEELGVPPSSQPRFLDFFSESPPQRLCPDYQGDELRVRYFGHACVLLQSRDVSILIDPLMTYDRDESAATLTFEDLPDCIDYVFITHNHQDHLCPEILLQLRNRIGRVLVPRNNPWNVADPSMKLTLQALGFNNVTIMDPLDRIEIPGGQIVSLPAYGEHADLSINSKHGMYVKLNEHTLAFLADSNCLDRALYRRLRERLGPVETLFLGMECDGAPLSWLYNCYLPRPLKRKDDESRRLSGCDSERARAVIEELG